MSKTPHTTQAPAEPMLRFCPGCGSVGAVPDTYRDCCPDGSAARVIPAALANKCHDLFQLGLVVALTPIRVEPASWPRLTHQEMSALLRFQETCDDGQGYDVPKPMMKRLAEIGVVNHSSGGIYGITDFGNAVIETPEAPVRVYLVATGETIEGMEQYTRNDTLPPMCDYETLYAAPQPAAPPAAWQRRDQYGLRIEAFEAAEDACDDLRLNPKNRPGANACIAAIRVLIAKEVAAGDVDPQTTAALAIAKVH